MPNSAGRVVQLVGLLAVLSVGAGCIGGSPFNSTPQLVFGRRGLGDGELQKPRAIAIDADDRLYIVDMTARIQVFTPDGEFLRSWQTPEFKNGRPTGLSIDRDGSLIVADTHYFRVLFFAPDGELLAERTIGGTCGHGPGQFEFVTDVAQDSQGNYYVSEYGQNDRIQKFSPQGEFLMQWGSHGTEPGQFRRPQSIAADESDRIWVADACNHRIQVFDASGDEARLVAMWGEEGTEPGQLRYPYGLILDGEGHVYVSEWGNHRVQKFTPQGKSLGVWGHSGRNEGELCQPWAVARDSRGRMFVLDSYNHRVQRFRL